VVTSTSRGPGAAPGWTVTVASMLCRVLAVGGDTDTPVPLSVIWAHFRPWPKTVSCC
jgi:hypothetical protein